MTQTDRHERNYAAWKATIFLHIAAQCGRATKLAATSGWPASQ
jgi:hypothetical protein